ncbi:organic solvent tolerance protein OstA [Marnyiella aurantia]|uniref:Organic solvent tolerance protein OstA n=1 Tax=Marnyiella aurantia TaxID=2758037 RepID=A0A7D7QFW1_9FLAO|nr:OstA-like protein [Marnyiella aurantia]MBA5247510.1 organic solvent tolerance protein OstA [Marnyiella aurantia]QMS99263.1 organic solvent tolerance protein OstA [Marnyiella aurantia]
MKKLLAIFLFASVQLMAQITTRPTDPLVKDPFFSQQQAQQKTGEKVKLVHADFVKKDPTKFNGNTFFEGNVQFDHQGSVVTSDFVIWYEKENFVKALGHVKLVNADGSVITAGEMEYDGNTQRGIAKKDVVLTDPKQTIRTETLYYDRISNKAYFNTGGTITDGQGIMYAKSATYNIATKLIDFTGNVKIENNQYIVDGTNIVQNQNTNVATFNGPTTIINRDNPSNRVYTESGTYNQNTKEVWLNKNSTIYYNNKTLVGDRMYFNQITGFGTATGNVTLNDPQERRYIKGGYGEIYEKIDSAMVTERAYAVKILENDSIYFSANRILAYQKMDSTNVKKSFLRAYRQARFFKSNIQSRSDSLSFNETDGVLHLAGSPIAWSGAKQVSGDKIEAYFDTENEYIDSLKVIGNAFAISKADSLNLKDEFNQVKGKLMTVYYKENQVNLANVIGNAQAVTYADDQNERTRETERIGVALSTCGIIEALFEERRVQIVSCNIGALTDIYPMSKISKEMRFLQGFNWNTKDRLLKWQDIFVDTPNYEEVQYTEDNPFFDAAQAEVDRARAEEEAKKPKRVRR